MLYLFFYYLLITGICFWAGIVFYSFISSENSHTRSLVNYLITGLIGITAIGQWIVLFFPVRIFTGLTILMVCGFISVFRRKRIAELIRGSVIVIKGKPVLFYLCVLCLLVTILILNSGPVIMDDTDSYHIQMVKWIQEYGSVPGIANLHLRFGFNSSWFVSIGLFSYPVAGLNSYVILNGLLSCWISYFLLEKIFGYTFSSVGGNSKSMAIGCGVIFLLCLINWPLIRGSACNSNYDFITTCCIIILFIDLDERRKEISLEWLIWPAFLFTVRMMNFPLLILSGIYCIIHVKQVSWQKQVIILSAGVFIIMPFLIRNAILSGYPFFPVYQPDFFVADWKVDKTQLTEISHYIKYFNRVNPMFQPIAVTERLDFPTWVLSWYNHLFRYDKLMVTLSVFGYAIIFFRFRKIQDRPTRFFLLGMMLQLISWFLIAPDPRFASGPLLFGIFTCILCLPSMKGTITTLMGYVLPLTCLFVFIYGLSKLVRDNEYRNFLIPHRLPVPQVQTIQVDHIQLHIPYKILNNWNPRCYDIALPCLYRVDPRLEARGKNISNGFRLKDMNANIPGEYKITD